MSFRSNPDNYAFAPVPGECISCFPTGETTETLFLTLQGIKLGDDWSSPDEAPPNGLWPLKYRGDCEWYLDDPPYSFLLDSDAFLTNLIVTATIGGGVFSSTLAAGCQFDFENLIDDPFGVNYFGGRAIFTAPIGTSAISNLNQMALLNLDPTSFFWVKPNFSLNGVFSNGYYRRRDSTNIIIQYDLP